MRIVDSLNNQYGFFNHNDYNIDDVFNYTAKKETTMKEICEALGYEVKIKKEDK